MFMLLIKWWYGPGWALSFKNIKIHTSGVSSMFSIPQLLRTLFEPWKRIITNPGKSLQEHFAAYVDNLVSRFIGFSVRIIVLLTSGILILLTAIFYGLIAIIWPLLPLALIYCIFRGITG
jgi:hypothetical protein